MNRVLAVLLFVGVVFLVGDPCFAAKEKPSTGEPYIVGVLENILDVEIGWTTPHVRVLFKKVGDRWASFPNVLDSDMGLEHVNDQYPDSVNWTVIFDGKSLGPLTSEKIKGVNAYCEVGVQHISRGQKAPRIKIGASDFSYFLDNPSFSRPLLLASRPYFQDPEKWKPAALTTGEKKKALEQFEKIMPTFEGYFSGEGEPLQTMNYQDSDLRFKAAFKSKAGDLLVGLHIVKDQVRLPLYSDAFEPRWFVLRENGKIQYLGVATQPMEAADLDQTGQSDWLFQNTGYDKDGYVLLYDGLTKAVTFSWIYH